MHELELTKPDGRRLTLYGRRPIATDIRMPAPPTGPVDANPHFRWHPLRGEWVDYAAFRQDRTFLPPAEYNPLLPSSHPEAPTELPAGDYDVAVFDNLFPAMTARARAPSANIVQTASANGHCEVVVFSQDPAGSLGALPLDHIELLLQVWARRTQVLAERPGIRYVLPFENRGAEVGVTLHHPHGQIYAYPFVPPVPQRMLETQLAHFHAQRRPLLEVLLAAELADGRRILYRGEHAVAFVPAWARYPYETWVAPIRAVPDFQSLDARARADLARALKVTLLKYDGLWQQPFPYVMAWYQTPLGVEERDAFHLHAELYPPYRMRGRLKYLAGTEIAAGMFANDALPEDKARELQAVSVTL